MPLAFAPKFLAAKKSAWAKPSLVSVRTWLARSAVAGAFLYVAGIVLLI